VAACEGNVTSPERETTPLSSRLMDVACIAGSRLAASRLEPGERSPSLSLSLSPSLPSPRLTPLSGGEREADRRAAGSYPRRGAREIEARAKFHGGRGERRLAPSPHRPPVITRRLSPSSPLPLPLPRSLSFQ